MTMSSLPLAFPASHAQIALRAKHADMPSWFLAQFMPSWFLTLFMPSWFLTLFMPSDIGKQCGLDRRKENWKRKNLCVIFPDISSSQCPMMSVHHVKFCASLGCKVKQTIHFNREGNATWSGNDSTKYLCESRNLDICVADVAARAVAVVDHTGALKSKYRYKGNSSSSIRSSLPTLQHCHRQPEPLSGVWL